MKIVAWNVNSIKSRLTHLKDFILAQNPDVILLQELKCQHADFPWMDIQALGYNPLVKGQKTYNGVAIISKEKAELIADHLPGDGEDDHARYIEARVGNTRVISVYVPNGQAVGSDKFAYKLKFFERLFVHAKNLLQTEERIAIGGDFNVALDPLDLFDVKVNEGSILFHPQERAGLRRLLNLGYVDAFRALHPDKEEYSWWDYRAGAFERDLGFRIDYMLLSPQAADHLAEAGMDKSTRALEKPSDHIPVWATLS
jgi:exodeoxyribonuclease-3